MKKAKKRAGGRPENAESMSRTALIKEVRRLRAQAKKDAERLKAARAEIERRDNATEHFKEMEPEKMRLICLLYPYDQAERRLAAEHGQRVRALSKIDELFADLSRYNPAQFWGGVLYENTMDALDMMSAAEGDEEARRIVSEAIERLEAEAAELPQIGGSDKAAKA